MDVNTKPASSLFFGTASSASSSLFATLRGVDHNKQKEIMFRSMRFTSFQALALRFSFPLTAFKQRS